MVSVRRRAEATDTCCALFLRPLRVSDVPRYFLNVQVVLLVVLVTVLFL